MNDKPVKLFVNLYDSGRGAVVFDSLFEATECAESGRVACIELQETRRLMTPSDNSPQNVSPPDSGG